ncbi:hypothetical protein MMC20_005502 [Loxospora ochrophaea]|nr:hypothetical protein [Loxospora ochrophaea]
MDPRYRVLPRPRSFNLSTSLWAGEGKAHDKCNNIQPGADPVEIFPFVKFEEQRIINFNDYLDDFPDVYFLDLVQRICIITEVKECLNERRQIIRRKMTNAPHSEWKRFREWALVLMSCQISAKEQGLEDGWKWGNVVHDLSTVAQFTRRDKMMASVDLFEICELINWMSTVNSHLYPFLRSQLPLRTHISKQKIVDATHTAYKVGICQNRLWNLTVGGGEREEVDLPILMMMVEERFAQFLKHRGQENHESCNAEVCRFGSIDSTRVKQLHKCPAKDCGKPLLFPPSEFEKPYKRFIWWTDDIENTKNAAYVVKEESQRQYMAISHVWSDGTGGGVQGKNLVNRCLWTYFKGVAQTLGCTAIWWDTICIPSERIARQKAIGKMHENFKQAAHTIIHDQYLVQLPWTEDGNPCLALLLSPWFTRAWTSLELMMTGKEKVSVIFRHPNDPTQYVIKNLKNDILAHHPAFFSRGHWVASSLLTQLREQQFHCIGDIFKLLKTKSTSWPRDLMVVAAIMTGHDPKVETPGFIAHTTREIILSLVEIEESFLYHGHATMTQKGGFSWCPFSLLDGAVLTNTDRPERVYVDEDGAVCGDWAYRALSIEDAKKVQPYSFHISVDWQIRVALERWKKCQLLQNTHNINMQALLVVHLDVGTCKICGTDYIILEASYIGTVYANLEWGDSYSASIRLGKLSSDPDQSAEQLVDKYYDTKGPRIIGRPWQKHLHSIKQARRQNSGTAGRVLSQGL